MRAFIFIVAIVTSADPAQAQSWTEEEDAGLRYYHRGSVSSWFKGSLRNRFEIFGQAHAPFPRFDPTKYDRTEEASVVRASPQRCAVVNKEQPLARCVINHEKPEGGWETEVNPFYRFDRVGSIGDERGGREACRTLGGKWERLRK